MKKIAIILIVLALVMSLWSSCYAGQGAKQPIKVLFLIDGCCHDFKNLPPTLADKLKATGDFECTITADREQLIPANISKFDIALLYTQGSDMAPEQEKGLTEFVNGGKGYVGIHCASDSFKNSDAYWKMVGGRFAGHGRGTFPVKFTAKRHEVVNGLDNFEITDETYNHKFHPDAKVITLARRETDGEPAVWVQYYGAGRVFFTGLGHGKEAWENETFQKLIFRGMYWAAGRAAVPAKTCHKTKCKK
ncbi:MAG: ThuA domain-containing protein [Armatimonadota bacterium]|nr:ThuA domain-containing protein [Armatimonadota bacterium]